MSPHPEPAQDPEQDPEHDSVPQRGWRVSAVVDSRLEADLVVHLLRGHGIDARAVLHRDGTADILVPEAGAEAARRALDVL